MEQRIFYPSSSAHNTQEYINPGGNIKPHYVMGKIPPPVPMDQSIKYSVAQADMSLLKIDI